MADHRYSTDIDQHDPKIFRESLGSFGTTTKPGGNQLQELQTKVRQGVKHVELHLMGTGKGQFNVQDVPDKYGFEQRRTIMQLAKLNKQTLSVHGSFDVTSFSGLTQNGFDDSIRLNSMKEIDETVKFAAETAKGGAVVFHIQGDNLSNDRSELNISRTYLKWLKKNRPDEYERLKENYFNQSNLNRLFVNNPEKEKEVREEFEDLKTHDIEKYNYYVNKAKSSKENKSPWELYYLERDIEKRKLTPDREPMVLLGNKIIGVQRQNEFVDIKKLTSKNHFNQNEIEILNNLGISVGNITIEDYQKAEAIFTNGVPENLKLKINEEDFFKL
ncbi:hypothetical protein D6829_02785, partial [Candidatus Pacearchaeota archaeon]